MYFCEARMVVMVSDSESDIMILVKDFAGRSRFHRCN